MTKSSIVKHYLLLILLCIGGSAVAQRYTIKGIVMDQHTNSPIEFASIGLFQLPDTVNLLFYTLSDSLGSFEIQIGHKAEYLCLIRHWSESSVKVPVKYEAGPIIDLGTIFLEKAQLLDAVQIVSNRTIESIAKTTFYVDSTLLSGSTTAFDVLQKIPDLQINPILESVGIRGIEGNIIVMINGVITPITPKLTSINPQDIEKVEIISNPSSEYEADVMGVINIVLKKNPTQGIYTGISANGLLPLKRVEFFPEFQYSNKKIRYAITYTYNFWGRKNNDSCYRKIEQPLMIDEYFSTQQTEKGKEFFHRITNDLDYYINNNNLFHLSFIHDFSTNRQITKGNTQLLHNSMLMSIDSFNTQLHQKYFSGNYTIFYKKTIKGEHQFTANFNFSHLTLLYDNQFQEYVTSITAKQRERRECEQNRQLSYNLKLDYRNPVNEKVLVSMGIMPYFNTSDNSLRQTLYDTTYRNAHFKGTAYFDILWNINDKSQMRIGNKVESWLLFWNKKKSASYINWLPSFVWMHKIDNSNTITLSFRTSNRYPSIWQLTPYQTSSADSSSFSAGNTALRPSTQYLLQLRHIYRSPHVKLYSTLYSFFVHHLIATRISVVDGSIIRQLYNRTGLFNISLNMNIRLSFFDEKLDIGLNATPFLEHHSGKNNSYHFSCNVSSDTYIALPFSFSIYAEYSYFGKRLTSLGKSWSYMMLYFSLSKHFLDNSLSLSICCQNPFFKNRSISTIELLKLYEWQQYTHNMNGFSIVFRYYFSKGIKNEKQAIDYYYDKDIK
jgi:hypothetical protein